jgi:large subunit ribosomal protein L28
MANTEQEHPTPVVLSSTWTQTAQGLAELLTSCKIRISINRERNPGAVMAQVCDVCGKGPQFGNNISHAHNVTKRRWNVNLRPVRAKVRGATKRIRVCTSCLRSGKVVKA